MKKLINDFLFHLVGILSFTWGPCLMMWLWFDALKKDSYPWVAMLLTGFLWNWSVSRSIDALWNRCFKHSSK